MKKESRMKALVAVLACTLAATAAAGGMVYADGQKNADAEYVSANDETVYVMTDTQGKEYQRIVSEKGTLHYDGYETAVMPVTMEICYRLNGKKISVSDLKGKSGHLEMTLHYKAHEKRGGVYIPFLAVSGIVLDHEGFKNVRVTEGKVVDDGNRSVVVGYALPGMAESLEVGTLDLPESVTVSADVNRFTPQTVYTVMSSDIFTELELGRAGGIHDLTDSLDQLTEGVDRLLKGTGQLSEGAEKLYTGSEQLTAGSRTLHEGAGQLSSGTDRLVTGTEKLKHGADQLADGAQQLKEGSVQLSEGADQLTAGLAQISANSEAICGGAEQIVASSLQTAQSALASQGLSVTLTKENYQTVLQQAAAAKPEAAPQLSAMENQISQIIAFYHGVISYTGGVDSAAAGAAQISENLKTLQAGAAQIYDGAAALRNGQQQIYDGTIELKDGAGRLKDGSALLYEKQQELSAGIAQLKKGADALKSGVKEMADKVSGQLEKLPAADLAKVLDRAGALEDAAQSYHSFGGKGVYDSVTFIFKSEPAQTGNKAK